MMEAESRALAAADREKVGTNYFLILPNALIPEARNVGGKITRFYARERHVRHLRVRIKQENRKLAGVEPWPLGDRCKRRRLASGPQLTGSDHVARLTPATCDLAAAVGISRVRRFGRHHAAEDRAKGKCANL
jgi:hypothetical protein